MHSRRPAAIVEIQSQVACEILLGGTFTTVATVPSRPGAAYSPVARLGKIAEVYSPPPNGRMSESDVFLTNFEKWCSRRVTFAQLVVW